MKALFPFLAGLCTFSAHAQYIQVMPTNYTITTRSEINIGLFRQRWVLESEQTKTLSTGILEVVNKTWFHPSYGVAFLGSKSIAPPLLEDRASYFYTGGEYHRPLGGEHIRYAPAKFGWQSATNPIYATNMEAYFFVPTLVGTIEEGNQNWRIQTVAPVLECHARNMGNDSRRLAFRCANWPIAFDYQFDFSPFTVKIVALGVGEANRRGSLVGQSPLRWFMVDWQATIIDWAL